MPKNINSIVERFPERELELHRRCSHDARFLSVCKDYEEAAAALRRWQRIPAEAILRAAEYARFLGELEAEILAELDRSRAGHTAPAHLVAPRRGRSHPDTQSHPRRDA